MKWTASAVMDMGRAVPIFTARADHRERCGCSLLHKGPGRADDPIFVDLEEWQVFGPRATSQDDMLGLEVGFFSLPVNLDLPPPRQTAVALHVGHFVLLEKVADTLTHLISNFPTTYLRRPEVESDILRYNPVLLAVLYFVDDQRTRKKCLGRYTADVEADAPQGLSLHARYAQAELRRPNCRYVTTRTTPNDDQVKASVALSRQPLPRFMKGPKGPPIDIENFEDTKVE